MTEKKQCWYKYTDESGRCWRLKVAPRLAEIGGLQPCDESAYPHIPDSIEPRYMWIREQDRPADRLPTRHKVILERGRFKEIMSTLPFPSWEVDGKQMTCISYYGETMYAQ